MIPEDPRGLPGVGLGSGQGNCYMINQAVTMTRIPSQTALRPPTMAVTVTVTRMKQGRGTDTDTPIILLATQRNTTQANTAQH